MKAINDLVELSKYAGERFDLVQAAGGNTSVKLDDGSMIIKASGYTLSEVNQNSGFSTVITEEIARIVKNDSILNLVKKRERESATSLLVKAATVDTTNRPSIETLLHSILLKYTLHTHPVAANILLSRNNFKTILKEIFKEDDVVFVEYKTPGIELAIELDKEIQKFKEIPKIIFLQNHGLIVTSDTKQDIREINEYVLEKIESYLHIDMSRYKLSNHLSDMLKAVEITDSISYLCDDLFLNDCLGKHTEILFTLPFCPDILVYCGMKALKLDSLYNSKPIVDYKTKYHILPKVIIYQNNLFFIAPNIKKAREIEEVFKFHIMVLTKNKTEDMTFLELDELAYLSNWEAEKFRQNI